MKNELWHSIAGGLLTSWAAKLAAITSQADRELQDNRGVWPGWLTVNSYGAMGYTISHVALGLLYDEIPDRISDPVIRDQIAAGKPPFVANPGVSGGNTLTSDAPGATITTMVYHWLNDGTYGWVELGTLTDHAQPGAGVYVLVNESESGALGLPSAFLTLTS